MAAIVFFSVLTIACADDLLANDFHIPFERLIEILQYCVLVGPVVGFLIAYKACQALQRTHAHPIQRPIGGIIVRTSDGAYHTLAEMHGNGHGAAHGRRRGTGTARTGPPAMATGAARRPAAPVTVRRGETPAPVAVIGDEPHPVVVRPIAQRARSSSGCRPARPSSSELATAGRPSAKTLARVLCVGHTFSYISTSTVPRVTERAQVAATGGR